MPVREHSGRLRRNNNRWWLVFTWISAGTDHRLSLVTVVFTPVEGGVRVELEHEGIPDVERARQHERGWTSILRKLASLDSLTQANGGSLMPETVRVTLHDVRFPNESAEYRAARDKLLDAEMALRRQTEGASPPSAERCRPVVASRKITCSRTATTRGDSRNCLSSFARTNRCCCSPAYAWAGNAQSLVRHAPRSSTRSTVRASHIEQHVAIAAVARSPIVRVRGRSPASAAGGICGYCRRPPTATTQIIAARTPRAINCRSSMSFSAEPMA